MAPFLRFCNLTNFYFSISPTEYAKNLNDEIYGCFKHVGMPWDMIMRLPIQERREIIRKHNIDQEAINREINGEKGSANERHYEGEQLNDFAKLEQMRLKNGGR